ncbi:hypothetical protein QE109_00730 [Fusibacter bizertensis]|uniref:Flagellar hook-length control protein FliK n=1 Tax=Fusibacter bizertensis TaxID=1488331 RepID=A0ABT6N896_9FIRM|nr:hypothetical protein [Fusibacter bizertensis]MDH8676645.1 hypothetical protein [Fusibacter bizertensis]
MRISQNNIVQSTISFVKGQTNTELKSMVGKVLQGHISGATQNQTALFVSGEQQLLVNIGDAKLSDQQALTLKIVDYKEGALIANIMTETNGQLANDSQSSVNASEILNKLGVIISAENGEIVEAMKSANVPMTKENFQAIRQSLIEVKTLVGELKQGVTVDFSKELSTPIKALVMKLIQQSEAQTSSGNTPNNASKISPDQAAQTSNLVELTNTVPKESVMTQNPSSQSNISNLSLPQTPTAQNPSAITANEIQTNLNANEGVNTRLNEEIHLNSNFLEKDAKQLLNLIVNKFNDSGNTAEAIKNLLLEFNLESDILHLKNEQPVSIKTVFAANEQINNKDIIVQKFDSILSHMSNLKFDKESVIALLEVMKSEDEDIEKLTKLSDLIRTKLPDSEVKTKLEQDIAMLKEHAVLSKPVNDQVVYMPINIQQGERDQKVSLYYKKNQKKSDFEDFTMLVALNTDYCGEVRCVIHKLKNQVSLAFNFETDLTKKVFEDSKGLLTESLNTFSQYQFNLSFSLRENQKFELNTFDYEENGFGFDIKV